MSNDIKSAVAAVVAEEQERTELVAAIEAEFKALGYEPTEYDVTKALRKAGINA